jgi:hypothetical protein
VICGCLAMRIELGCGRYTQQWHSTHTDKTQARSTRPRATRESVCGECDERARAFVGREVGLSEFWEGGHTDDLQSIVGARRLCALLLGGAVKLPMIFETCMHQRKEVGALLFPANPTARRNIANLPTRSTPLFLIAACSSLSFRVKNYHRQAVRPTRSCLPNAFKYVGHPSPPRPALLVDLMISP